jgi:multiple sugar transport system permease protein
MKINARSVTNGVQILLIFLVVLTVLLPFYWTFKVSVSPEKEIRTTPIKWGISQPTFKNYRDILFSSPKTIGTAYTFKVGLINSLLISVITTIITVFLGSLGAYALTRLKIRHANVMTFFVLLTQMLPPVLLIIPLYFTANQLNLLNTKTLLVICYVAMNLPLCIWIMRGYFVTLPSAIEESALIDGCGRMGALFRIVMPLSGPALFTAGLFVFNSAWNEFLFALTFTSDLKAKTMTVAMAEMIGRFRTDYGLMATSGILGSILPLIFVAFFQKYLVSGITGGAVKQ